MWPIVTCALFAVGCGQTPTSPSAAAAGSANPSSATSGSAISTLSQPTSGAELPPITIAPPRALGATRYVAFGDSITWGATSAWDQGFFFLAANGGYVERLQLSLNTSHSPQSFTVFNHGLPGEAAVDALPRFRSVLMSRRPEVVLLLEGINDLAGDVSISRIITALRQMIDTATGAGIPVLIATMFPTYATTNPQGQYRPNGAAMVPAFNVEIRRLATGRLNVYLVDLEPVMRDRHLVGNDGIHLTDAGFEVMSSTFLAAIQTAFPVRGSFQ